MLMRHRRLIRMKSAELLHLVRLHRQQVHGEKILS
jgi:hypothetical protein